MKKFVFYFLMFIFLGLLVATLWLDDKVGSLVVNIVTIVTAIIGAISLFVEFKRNRKISISNLMMDYSKSFFNCDFDLYGCFSELEEYAEDTSYKFDYEKCSDKIVIYLHWIESIASLVERGSLDLYTIDNVLSYRFFILVNNPYVQKNELIPNAEFYRGTYYLYNRWYKFEQQRGIDMPLDETALRNIDGYNEILHRVFGDENLIKDNEEGKRK